MTKRGFIISAATASGKTHYVREHADAQVLIDGDNIIRATIGWPKDPEWYLDPDVAEKTHLANWNAIHDYIDRLSHMGLTPIVLFNGGVPFTRPDIGYSAVEIPLRAHEANLAARREGAPHGHPTEYDLILENRAATRSIAETRNWPIHTSFDAAVAAIAPS